MTVATWITVSRLLVIPFFLYVVSHPDGGDRWLALALFLLAALTDWLDGYVARRFNQVTDLGKFLDPLVDKLLIFAPLLVFIEWGLLPAWGVFLVLTRELTIAGWRVNQPNISGANLWGKAKTVSQIVAISLLLAPLPEPWPRVGVISFWAAVALTLISGVIYLLPPGKTEPDSLSQT
ncbi:CDP-diacylglycerol--glycerol-3-phosphate 3-phosphatidyltransferase [Sodalinema gerasimenkoae]|uniref:CDP-diacylglycerol--glycerol-3-phosphate 3-phosphatidyltransferase n=1 Tax=Sodalinema gerasimenkoae TaxID=2862348 RepID=UPI0013596F01|nr:CDP-diacylglycerol--glycerol-3-phosphate 3-phosphatidyltransferase [Sodalinema gerasimenkoae]